MAHIFISYSRKDQEYAHKLADDICQHGFDVWVDDRIDYGDRWWRTIEDALKGCAAFVVIMSPDAEKSEWVERETLLAQREGKPIFPLLLEGREFSLLITAQYANVVGGKLPDDDFYERLKEVVTPAQETGVSVAPSEKPWWRKPEYFVPILVAIIVGIFGLWQGVFANNGRNTPAPTIKPSDTIEVILAPTLSGTDLEQTVQAQIYQIQTEAAQTVQANEAATPAMATAHAQMTVYAQGTSDIHATETATLWTSTPTPDTRLTAEARLTQTATLWTPTPTLSSEQRAMTPVTRNADWTPYERDFDGVTMVLERVWKDHKRAKRRVMTSDMVA